MRLVSPNPSAVGHIRVQTRREQVEGSSDTPWRIACRQKASHGTERPRAIESESGAEVPARAPDCAVALAASATPVLGLGHGRTISNKEGRVVRVDTIKVASNSARCHRQVAALVAWAVNRVHRGQLGRQRVRDSGRVLGKEFKAERAKECKRSVHGASCAASAGGDGDAPARHSVRGGAHEVRIVVEGCQRSGGHAQGRGGAVTDSNLGRRAICPPSIAHDGEL